eukprot:TRINITY_DN1162_c0_g1_i1.p1 TRINITY_DN1162_c0_g1~~TRINITY_DN1162_c0_g1_i1.p1  ORF type:complete len:670 (+),score=166.17 TRINITY_DN1162_c0_g1_i1:93-2102(+)
MPTAEKGAEWPGPWGGENSTGVVGQFARWLGGQALERAKRRDVVVGGSAAIASQAVGIWLYGMWRDWSMHQAFFPRLQFTGRWRRERPAPATAAAHPSIPREHLADVKAMLQHGLCAYLFTGSLGCGKTWLLSQAVLDLRQKRWPVVYLDVRPRSNRQEFIVQLADVTNFRFQRPTSWLMRLCEWIFAHHWWNADDKTDDAPEVSDEWHRLTAAIESTAVVVDRASGRVPTLVIDNLQNLLPDWDAEEGRQEEFTHAVLDWAAWCADNECLRVIIALPSTARTKRLLEENPHAQATLQLYELPVLTQPEVARYLSRAAQRHRRAPACERDPTYGYDKTRSFLESRESREERVERRCAEELTRTVESPLWAKKMWDMRVILGRSWGVVANTFHAEGTRILRQYDLRSLEMVEDAEDNLRRARVWRLLICLADEHSSKRHGVRPYTKRMLGDRAHRDIEALLDASLLSWKLISGEIRIRSPPLRYIVRRMAGTAGSEPRRRIMQALLRLDPEGGELNLGDQGPGVCRYFFMRSPAPGSRTDAENPPPSSGRPSSERPQEVEGAIARTAAAAAAAAAAAVKPTSGLPPLPDGPGGSGLLQRRGSGFGSGALASRGATPSSVIDEATMPQCMPPARAPAGAEHGGPLESPAGLDDGPSLWRPIQPSPPSEGGS